MVPNLQSPPANQPSYVIAVCCCEGLSDTFITAKLRENNIYCLDIIPFAEFKALAPEKNYMKELGQLPLLFVLHREDYSEVFRYFRLAPGLAEN